MYQPGSSSRLDTEKTAQQCLANHKNQRVRNFQGWQVMRYANHVFSDFIKKEAKLVDDAAKNPALNTDSDDRDRVEDFDKTRTHLIASRAGDHGVHLVKAADAVLGPKMTVYKVNLWPDPTDPSKTLETVDWKATADAAKKAGVPNYQTEILNFRQDFYHGKDNNGKIIQNAKNANDHRVVINLYQRGQDRSRRCR